MLQDDMSNAIEMINKIQSQSQNAIVEIWMTPRFRNEVIENLKLDTVIFDGDITRIIGIPIIVDRFIPDPPGYKLIPKWMKDMIDISIKPRSIENIRF